MSKRLRSQEGTTLLEVMIAVAIAAIALVSFLILILASLEMEDQARKMTSATLIAEAKLKEMERMGFPELTREEGMADESDPTGFYYRTVVAETPIEEVRQVEVEVFWEKKTRSVSLVGYYSKK
jgi:general secretion pathway protein I